MKRRIFCALLLALALSGCASKQEAEPALTVGGVTLNNGSSLESVLDVFNGLGGEYEYAEAVSCVYDGMDKTYTYENAVVYAYPDGERDRLMELYCSGGDVKTPAGVTFGDTKEKVVKTYGDGFVERGASLAYEREPSADGNEPASLYFEFSDGKVTAIGITAEHRSE